ncbi:MAG: 2-phospho-L-lactate guanylyltransferase [Pseudomonadota bacterium]|nr:2-phospho-L-lactate guanylyltransferase [Pseudomonadota bacterium]
MITAVVPMKPLKEAKRRLSGVFDDPARQQLATLMLGEVLACLVKAPDIDKVLVLSADESIREIAAVHGCSFLREPSPRGLDCAIALAADILARNGARSMLFMPGDVPLVSTGEIAAVAQVADAAAVVLVPSHDREGTNAMLMSPPGVISPAFGAGSFERHVSAAKVAGSAVAVVESPGLSFDIDTAADLPRLAAARSGDSRYDFVSDCLKSLAGEAV